MNKLLPLLLIAVIGCAGLKIEKVSPNRMEGKDSKDEVATNSKISNDKNGEKVFKIDDFEDGDLQTFNSVGWYNWNDQDNGGGSSVTLTVTPKDTKEEQGFKSKGALTIDFSLIKKDWKYNPYVGVGSFIIRGSKPFDASEYVGVRYNYKGAEHSIKINTTDVTDYDSHAKLHKASSDWTTVEVPFDMLRQEGWGKQLNFDKKLLKKIEINIVGKDGDNGQLVVDNIEFYTVPKIIKKVVSNLQIKPQEDPAVDIGDITISNPLQAKAMKYLTQGVNVSNWLEADEYNYSMEYNEDDIKLMSELGFKSMRLPINIDDFLKNRSSYFTSNEAPDFKSDLFMVIDKFADWTKKYNMSLTVDHHQYNRSLNGTTQNDPQYASQFGKMVKEVVKHIASLNREDIFFELYNEPDDKIFATQWHSIAAQAIDSIRTGNKSVTLIVGSEFWYNLKNLIQMVPFKDDNIVYAFHFYEPFVFTHQGATWVDGAGSIMNVPFPYNEKEWKDNTDYYGVFDDTPDWLKSQLVDYYKIAGKNAILKELLKAKKWGVKNNVPVICNEFGALKRGTTLESRVNYIRTLRENFETLEIPWQHWEWKRGLGILDENDKKEWKAQEGIIDAFGLNK